MYCGGLLPSSPTWCRRWASVTGVVKVFVGGFCSSREKAGPWKSPLARSDNAGAGFCVRIALDTGIATWGLCVLQACPWLLVNLSVCVSETAQEWVIRSSGVEQEMHEEAQPTILNAFGFVLYHKKQLMAEGKKPYGY